MRTTSLSKKELIKLYGHIFKKMYLSGMTVEKISQHLKISRWHSFRLKRELNLHIEHWQRLKIPYAFTNNTYDVLVGTLLGDAHLQKGGKRKYYEFKVSHGPKQIKYLKHLRCLLSETHPYPIRLDNYKWKTFSFYSPPHPAFSKLQKLFYHGRKKYVNSKALKYLTAHGLAIWFMDDGSLNNDRMGFSIATCGFDIASQNRLLRFLKNKFNIHGILRTYDYSRLYFYSENALKFKMLISPFVHASMKYKLNLKQTCGIRANLK